MASPKRALRPPLGSAWGLSHISVDTGSRALGKAMNQRGLPAALACIHSMACRARSACCCGVVGCALACRAAACISGFIQNVISGRQ